MNRWGGVAAITAGTVLVALGLADPPGRLAWYAVMAVLNAATVAVLMGSSNRSDTMAKGGLILALAGGVSLTVGQVAILWSSSLDSFRTDVTHPLALSLQSLGFLLFAIALLRVGDRRAIVLAAAAIGSLSLATLATYAVPAVNLTLRTALGGAWIWLGGALWSSARRVAVKA